jgi:hypothetical protein
MIWGRPSVGKAAMGPRGRPECIALERQIWPLAPPYHRPNVWSWKYTTFHTATGLPIACPIRDRRAACPDPAAETRGRTGAPFSCPKISGREQVPYGHGSGIGRILRKGFMKVQYGLYHVSHLVLTRPSVATNRLLYLHWVVVAYGQAEHGSREKDPTSHLSKF